MQSTVLAANHHGCMQTALKHILHVQDNVSAALAMQNAHEMDSACSQHAQDLERLLRRVPPAVADVLEVSFPSGSALSA